MIFNISVDSRVGCVRENNEDMVLVGEHFVRDGKLHVQVDLAEKDRYLIALADGMGGHESGEVASSDVLHNIQFFYGDIPSGLTPGDLNESFCEWLESMNNNLNAKGRADVELKNMGTTFVSLAYYEKEFYWLNCGDSRLYRMRDGKLSQVTTDHSLSNMMGTSEHSNVITNCIGAGASKLYLDMQEITDDFLPGDVYMLCSDGLNDMVPDFHIETLMRADCTANQLCEAAVDAGGYDNVSVIKFKVVD
jgi:protein phosphatase